MKKGSGEPFWVRRFALQGTYGLISAVQADAGVGTAVGRAGGGIAGSSLFRYFAEAGRKTVLVNADRGSSWRNIGGGRPAFSIPELAEISRGN